MTSRHSFGSVDDVLEDDPDAEQIARVRSDLVDVVAEIEEAQHVLDLAAETRETGEDAVDARRDALRDAGAGLQEATDQLDSIADDFNRVATYYTSGEELCPECGANMVTVHGLTQNEHVCRHCELVESEHLDPSDHPDQAAQLACLVTTVLGAVAWAFGGVVVSASVASWLTLGGLLGFLALQIGVDRIEERARAGVAGVMGW